MKVPSLMLASPSAGAAEAVVARLQAAGGWSWEFKIDGIRALVHISDGRVRITNRRARDITFRYPEVVERLTGFPVDVTLDGEIACMDAAGRPDFSRIHRRDAQGSAMAARQLAQTLPAVFVVFDILATGTVDLRALTYALRRQRLEQLAGELAAHGVVSPPVSHDGPLMWQAVCDLGLEGLVAKRLDSRYVGRRSPLWVKVKRTRRVSALVSGWDPGEGWREATFGALRLALLDREGQLVAVGSVGSGFSDADVQLVWRLLQDSDDPIVVEVEYLEFSPSGHLRQPVFKGVRSDVPITDCTLDQVSGKEGPC